MNSEPALPRTWKRWWQRVVRWNLVFLTLYVLSIGPCFWSWFEATHVDGAKWIVALYLPLALLSDLCPPFGALLNWYINLWIL